MVHIFNLWCRFGVVWAIDHIQFEGFPVAWKVLATPHPIKDFLTGTKTFTRLLRKSSSEKLATPTQQQILNDISDRFWKDWTRC